LRVYVGLFVIVLLVALGRVEPAIAQECDPDACSNPSGNVKAHRKHKHIATKKRSAAQKVKHQFVRY
jgi:hypothetical protein